MDDTDSFVLVAQISLELSNSFYSKVLSFSSVPSTVVEIKSRIEEVCSIPACVQKLTYNGACVADSCTTESLYLREGDVVQVLCPNKGTVEDVKSVVEWLGGCVQVLEDLHQNRTAPLSPESKVILWDTANSYLVRQTLFSWSDPSQQLVNCYHFDCLGGIQLLVKFHELLVKNRQIRPHLSYRNHSRYLEFVCCQAICKFCVNNELCKRITESGGLQSCIGTFLMNGLLKRQDKYFISVALEAIYNIADSPNLDDKYLELIQDSKVLNQVLALARSSLHPNSTLLCCVSFLVCITRSFVSTKIILTHSVIEDIIEICFQCKEKQSNGDESLVMTLEVYTGVVLAHVVFSSKHDLVGFPDTLLERMADSMKRAIEVDAKKVQQYEESDGIVWGTFLHCVQCLYEPLCTDSSPTCANSSQVQLVHTLYELGTNVLLHYMLISLGRNEHFQVIVDEGIYDYVTLLPWVLPPVFQEKTLCVCKELSKFQPTHPAPLVTVAKAYFAKYFCGLHKVMNADLISDLL